ncbi:MAG: hypothetical protein AABY16_04460 [Nanoarchaeota archaeon]
MNKKVLIGSTLALVAILGVVMFLVSAQTSPGSEVTALFFFEAMPLTMPANATQNLCMSGAPAACIDTDGGYNPVNPSMVAANVISMIVTPNTFPPGTFSLAPANTPYQCIQASELCSSTTELFEIVCGSNVGIPNAAAFNAAFLGNIWFTGIGGEPVALMRVNCAIYAANNPQLGLTGVCSAGACI